MANRGSPPNHMGNPVRRFSNYPLMKGEILMNIKNDLTGQKFGMLTVLEFAYKKDRKNFWLCQCECGNVKIIRQDCFKTTRSIKTVSCGCYNKVKNEKNKKPHRDTKLYRVYHAMKSRCYNPNDKAFKWYGARGIEMHKEWLDDFENFFVWAIENGYEEGLTIERIDVNKDYCPNNCKWITQQEQVLNTRRNRRYEYKDEFLTITELSEKYNINRNTLNYRLNVGWDIVKAIETPVGFKN